MIRFVPRTALLVGFVVTLWAVGGCGGGGGGSHSTGESLVGRYLVLLCHESSAGPRVVTTRAAGLPLEQGAGKPEVHRGDGRWHMAFRPHRERPAA